MTVRKLTAERLNRLDVNTRGVPLGILGGVCGTRFSKCWPYFRPKHVICHAHPMQETIDGFLFSSLQGSRIATSNIGLIWTLSSKPKPFSSLLSRKVKVIVLMFWSFAMPMLAMLPRELYSKPITPSPYYTRLDSSQSLPYETMMAALSHPYRLMLDHDDLTKK